MSKSGIFLSTPSMRRATWEVATKAFVKWISIHALHEEGDISHHKTKQANTEFLSTPSMRRATIRFGQ